MPKGAGSPTRLAVIGWFALVAACATDRVHRDDDPSEGDSSDEDSSDQEAAAARPGGTVPSVTYDSGPNVADVEDRGADCELPALAGFADLAEEPLMHDPFSSLDGSRIKEKADWTCRRAEIAALVQAYELGRKPPKPRHVSGEFEGDVITVIVDDGGDSISFSASISFPESGSAPYPALIVLGGATALDFEGNISGLGVATIQFPQDELASQAGSNAYGDGLFFDLYGDDHPAGALMAWAWGVSRLIDALSTTPEANVDPARLGVTGCSRNGKGALVVGAFDERIALTLPQESGAGGSALWRMAEQHHREWLEADRMPDYADVQTLASAANENAWFRKSFREFGSAVDRLPFDHHMVMGLVAPRALLMVNNTEQYWLDRRGSHFGSLFAHEIWEALGAPSNMGGSQVANSTHCFDVPQLQLEHVAAYVARFLVGASTLSTEISYTDGGFTDVTSEWIDWRTPVLE